MKLYLKSIFCFLLISLIQPTKAQLNESELIVYFDSLSQEIKGLDEEVDFSVSNIAIKDFLRAIASSHDLNMVIDPKVTGNIYNNFVDVKVSDVLIYLMLEHDLQVNTIGNIIEIEPQPIPEAPIPSYIPSYNIDYNPNNNWITIEAHDDTLSVLAKEITEQTGVNLIIEPELQTKMVNCFIKDRPLEEVLNMFAKGNGLAINKENDRYYTFTKPTQKKSLPSPNHIPKEEKSQIHIEYDDSLHLNLTAFKKPLKEILSEVAEFSGHNYVLYDEPQGDASILVNHVTFEQFLTYLLSGTELTYREQQGIFLIGNKKEEHFRASQVIKLDYRTVENITEFIPEELKSNLDLKIFPELNALIVSGPEDEIEILRNFIVQIDRTVPVVKIEVMIIDFRKNHETSIGTDMYLGIGDVPSKSSGSLTGSNGGQATLNSGTINSLINAFNGFGWFNLGAVSPDFYMTIQAMEANGNLKVRSTPMIATLNGHEATLTIGNTEYYLETTNNLVGSLNPVAQTSQLYKPVNADLNLTIKPFVSSDGHVTLQVEVSQSDFTGRISDQAPPGQISRTFSSLIRVKDGEMIILGGLEEDKSSANSQGLPWISRIPVFRWIFGRRSKTKSDSKLHIFIKPTIIY